jgi:pyruvate-ferredoxin/flavodoxin oxidoreductase
MTKGMQNQKAAVNSGHWPLFRFDPRRADTGENPFQLDSRKPNIRIAEYLGMENRYKMLTKSHPQEAKRLWKLAQEDVDERWRMYEKLAEKWEMPEEVKAAAAK